MQIFMLCKCVSSRKLFPTNSTFMSLVLMYNSNMSSKLAGSFKCLIADITFRNHVIILLILMCNTVTIPYSYLLH